jgi:hypothetical protein
LLGAALCLLFLIFFQAQAYSSRDADRTPVRQRSAGYFEIRRMRRYEWSLMADIFEKVENRGAPKISQMSNVGSQPMQGSAE